MFDYLCHTAQKLKLVPSESLWNTKNGDLNLYLVIHCLPTRLFVRPIHWLPTWTICAAHSLLAYYDPHLLTQGYLSTHSLIADLDPYVLIHCLLTWASVYSYTAFSLWQFVQLIHLTQSPTWSHWKTSWKLTMNLCVLLWKITETFLLGPQMADKGK